MDPLTRIRELLATEGGIAALSIDELAELRGLVSTATEATAALEATPEVVEALNELADAAEAHAAEQGRRDAEIAANEEAAQAALARINGTTTEPEVEETEGDGETETPAETEPPAEVEPVVEEVREPIAAAAVTRPTMTQLAQRSPARTRPRQNAVTPAETTPTSRVKYTDSTGNRLTTRDDVVQALADTINRAGTSLITASAVTARREFPTERTLNSQWGARNDTIVASALSADQLGMDALVAAGGLCAPIPSLYDVDVVGSTDRPIRDTLPSFETDRGGISLRQGPYFGSWAAASSTWTMQNDQDNANGVGTPPPTKAVFDVTCMGFTDFVVQAIYTRLRFRNVTSRFDPEGTAANLQAVEIAKARLAENALLAQMAAQSRSITFPQVLGAARDILTNLDHVLAQWRSYFRANKSIVLEAFLPLWVKDMIRADITRGETSIDGLSVADAKIQSWFTDRGVIPTWHLDGNGAATGPTTAAQVYGAQTNNTAGLGFPNQVEILLHPVGSFLHLDGGTLDLGVIRDTTTNANNTYELFSEEWEFAAFRGTPGQALRVVTSVNPTGLSAGRIDTSAIAD